MSNVASVTTSYNVISDEATASNPEEVNGGQAINEYSLETSSSEGAIQQVEPAERVPSSLACCDASGWITLLPELSLSGVAKTLAFHCTVARTTPDAMWLVLDQAYDTLYNTMNHQRIEAALKQHFSGEFLLYIKPGLVKTETPAMHYERWKKEQLLAARQSIYADANVQHIIATYAAKVDEGSIKPRKK